MKKFKYNQLILTGMAFIFLKFSFIIVSFSQNDHSKNSEGLILFEKAKKAIKLNNYIIALEYYEKAIPKLLNEKQEEQYCEAYVESAILYYLNDDLDKALKYLLIAKGYLESKLSKELSIYGACLSTLSTLYYDKRNIPQSLVYDNEALNILESTGYDLGYIATLLNNMALSKDIIGDYSGAINDIKKAIEYQKKIYGKTHHETATSFYNLGVIYTNKNEYELAKHYYLSNLKILKKLNPKIINIKENEFIQVFQRLAYCYLELNQFDSTQFYIVQALTLQESDVSFRKYLSFEINAKLSQDKNEMISSIEAAKEAIRLAHIAFKKYNKHPNLARQYTHLGEIYQKANQMDSAVAYFHKAFLFLAHDFENPSEYENPEAEQCFPEYFVIRSLKGKARALFLRYQQSRELRDLKASLETYQLTHEFIGRLKQDISTMGSKQQLAGDVLDVYEGAIETAVALFEATGDQAYLENALFFAEANKAILLLESINERMAQTASGIPDSLLEKEKQYRVDIAYYERSINEENNKKQTEPDKVKIKKWNDLLYTLRREYQQLIDRFEEVYPRYFQLKYDTRLATLKDIRQGILEKKTAFLEYFVGINKIFLFQITKQNFQVFTFEKPEKFQSDINQMLQLARKQQLKNEKKKDFQQLIYRVYHDYLEIAIKALPSSIDRLFIVPDDVFNLVPFEMLSSSETELSYLIQEYNIGYSYSATLFKTSQQRNNQQASKGFLGFAPSFSAQIAEQRDCSGEVLANLLGSQDEITTIQQMLGGDILMGDRANRDFFMNQAAHYKILHLATHACMDEENPMQSKVFFADEPIVNQELFNLNLSADLAVLSACNTGSGQLVKGDGVMSLSKGFVHAGCPSALMSLWSVDDYSTSQIMIDFYKYLKKGYSKDQAIRQAKLTFLATADKVKQHPFFWAPFVQMGDPVPLDLGGGMEYWWWMAILGGIGMFLLLLRRSILTF